MNKEGKKESRRRRIKKQQQQQQQQNTTYTFSNIHSDFIALRFKQNPVWISLLHFWNI